MKIEIKQWREEAIVKHWYCQGKLEYRADVKLMLCAYYE